MTASLFCPVTGRHYTVTYADGARTVACPHCGEKIPARASRRSDRAKP